MKRGRTGQPEALLRLYRGHLHRLFHLFLISDAIALLASGVGWAGERPQTITTSFGQSMTARQQLSYSVAPPTKRRDDAVSDAGSRRSGYIDHRLYSPGRVPQNCIVPGDLRKRSLCSADPLYDAIGANNLAAVRKYARDAAGEYKDVPYLCWAIAKHSSMEVLQILLDNGADVNVRYHPGSHPPQGETPIMGAATYGTPEAIRFLLRHGAKLQARNGIGLNLLLAYGADPNASNALGQTAFKAWGYADRCWAGSRSA